MLVFMNDFDIIKVFVQLKFVCLRFHQKLRLQNKVCPVTLLSFLGIESEPKVWQLPQFIIEKIKLY